MAQNGLVMTRVRVLPDSLIDQIAAGEVVERPASVVKELVENAFDAGAQRIRVEVRDGGKAWIAITDDGCGMSPEDARLALERHATSKLASAEDLNRIATFGFRGEALPAIASIARFRLRTRPSDSETAHEIQVESGRVLSERETGGSPGTRVEVADLFVGVPARRKFLKTAATEWGHIADWLTRSALSHPEVHFDIWREDRPALSWPSSERLLDRIASVLSEEEASTLVPLEGARGELRLRGYASRPDHHRTTAMGLYLFVNGRPVRDRLLRHALLETYRDWLPRGRYPTALLFLELPFDQVDVNVHPAKWEVRFSDPRAIHHLVRETLRAAIAERRWYGGAAAPRVDEGEAVAHVPLSSAVKSRADGSPAAVTPTDWIFAGVPSATDEVVRDRVDPGVADLKQELSAFTAARLRFGDLRCIGSLFATYLVLEGKDRLILVDQHAAHERVLYERLRAEWLARGVERQPLLITTTVEVEPRLLSSLCEASAAALRLGFEIEPFGERAVAVRAVPALLADRDPRLLVRNLAEEFASVQDLGSESLGAETRLLSALDQTFATLACHSARRAGEELESLEQRALLNALDGIPWAPCCPHGRPVAVVFDLAEIERRFRRR